MKLNIYDKKTIVKTYEADEYDLLFGTVEDLLDLVDLDKLETGSDVEIIQIVGNVLLRGKDLVKSLFKDIFDGLTDDELKHTRTSDLASVLIKVVKFAITQMSTGANGKN